MSLLPLLTLLLLTLTASTHALPHTHHAQQHILSEVAAAVADPPLPGETCYNAHKKLDPNGEETKIEEMGIPAFCESAAEHLTDSYPNEKEFRSACNDAFGAELCFMQCRELGGLFDAMTLKLAPEKAQAEKFLSHKNKEYKLEAGDCVKCLQFHACTPDHARDE